MLCLPALKYRGGGASACSCRQRQSVSIDCPSRSWKLRSSCTFHRPTAGVLSISHRPRPWDQSVYSKSIRGRSSCPGLSVGFRCNSQLSTKQAPQGLRGCLYAARVAREPRVSRPERWRHCPIRLSHMAPETRSASRTASWTDGDRTGRKGKYRWVVRFLSLRFHDRKTEVQRDLLATLASPAASRLRTKPTWKDHGQQQQPKGRDSDSELACIYDCINRATRPTHHRPPRSIHDGSRSRSHGFSP